MTRTVGQLWAPLSSTVSLSLRAAIYTGRRGVGNAVCRNFLFPLGWPACGLNSTLAGPPTLPAGWVAQLRRRRGAKRQAAGYTVGLVVENRGVVDRPTSPAKGKWCTQREALASTVRDQMTRASAHNNGLFTLRSDPIPSGGSSNPFAERSRIENRTSETTSLCPVV